MITAAIILAEAAVLYEHLEATQTQAYGPEARGGATRSDVIISDAPIRFPKVTQPNVLVCLTQGAYNKFAGIIRPGGLLLTDSKYVQTAAKVDARQVRLPMYQAVMDTIGKPIVFNICTLGVVLALTDAVKPDSVMKVLQSRIPKDFLEMNRRALDLGMDLGKSKAA